MPQQNTLPLSHPVKPASDLEYRARQSKRPRLTPVSDQEVIMVVDSSDEDFEYGVDDDDAEDFAGGDFSDYTPDDAQPAIPGLERLEEDISWAEIMLESTGVTVHLSFTDLVITIPLTDLPPAQCAAYGLQNPDPFRIVLQLTGGYRKTSPKPVVTVRHGDPKKEGYGIETSSLRAHPGFPIGLKLTQTTLGYLEERWENRGEGFLSDLALRLNDRLLNAGNTCMMCDPDLPFGGIKPTVCDKDLCSYQLDSLGLGADLSLFDTDHQVADLLLTAAVAACNDVARQTVSPVAMPVNRRKGGGDAPYTPTDLRLLIDKLPSAEVLHDAGQHRTSLLKDIDPNAAFVAGWVFATNRAHVVSLDPEKHIAEMNTPHQFQIHTSTRKHAEKFEALRAQHGSFFAFHGSSMSNWHNILRQNLKNASKTSMMSTGAAYGEGVYLAASSGTSSMYARAFPGWVNSRLGSAPICLALVEVANSSRVHKHMQDQIIVASDENAVMLRQLFVYSQGGLPSIRAKDIVQARFKNRTTIAFGSTFEDVQASGKLLITSDDYFWDIDEVVESVKAKNGLFINAYNNVPFAPRDVEAIMNHPSGAGKQLAAIERENATLKKHISPAAIHRLQEVGKTCLSDNSEDFATAMAAISALSEWLKQRPAKEREALARVPFQATDSHTRIPFRNTVAHALELVISGGECTHRFGDFLRQVK